MLEVFAYILGASFFLGVISGLLGIPSPRDVPKNFRLKPQRPPSQLLLQAPPLVQLMGPVRRGIGQRVLESRQLPKARDQGDSAP